MEINIVYTRFHVQKRKNCLNLRPRFSRDVKFFRKTQVRLRIYKKAMLYVTQLLCIRIRSSIVLFLYKYIYIYI